MRFYENRILPYLIDCSMSGESFDKLRKRVLADVSGEVLEVGFGTGLNLPHYPATVSHLTVIDPNAGGFELAKQRIADAPFPVTVEALSGEQLPMADGSFDCVVSTFTLCTIPDVDKALAEIWRVLRENGRFVFVEHGLSPDPSVQRWQNWLNPVQNVIAGGCNLIRNMRTLIGQQFAHLEIDERYVKGFKAASYFYQGVGYK